MKEIYLSIKNSKCKKIIDTEDNHKDFENIERGDRYFLYDRSQYQVLLTIALIKNISSKFCINSFKSIYL